MPPPQPPNAGWGPAPGPAGPHPNGPAPWPGQPGVNSQAPRNKKKGRGCIIAFLVVLAIILTPFGAGAWLWLGIGKGDVLWSVDFSSTHGDTQNYRATWFTDKYVVRAELQSVLGLDAESGNQAWSVLVPDRDALICAASSVSSQEIAVLAYGKMGTCSHAFAVDLRTGKLLWDKPLRKDVRKVPSLAVSGGAVVLENGTAYRLRSGKPLWKSSDLDSGNGCSPGAYTGGDVLVRTQSCDIDSDANSALHVISRIDPKSGKVLWTYRAKKRDTEVDPNAGDGDVVTTSPILAREGKDAYRVLTDEGKPQALLPVHGSSALGSQLREHPGSPSPSVLASGDTLLVKQATGEGADDVLQAFSVSSGEKLWSKDSTAGGIWYTPAHADDDRLVAMKYNNDEFTFPPDKKVSSLVEFDPATGEESEIQNYQAIGDTLGDKYDAMPYLHDGKLMMASLSAQGSVSELIDGDGPIGADFHPLSLVVLET